jgi:two-component system, NtrC family, sensor kinase
MSTACSTPESGVERHEIRIVTRRQENLAIIEIHDTGMGIPPELQDRIFEPFLMLRPGGGTTGLSLCDFLSRVKNRHMEKPFVMGEG